MYMIGMFSISIYVEKNRTYSIIESYGKITKQGYIPTRK